MISKTDEIVVTGMAVITPLGNDLDEVWEHICAGHSAALEFEDLKEEGFRFASACRLPFFEYDRKEGRGYTMALRCIQAALRNAELKLPVSAGLYIGSTIGESEVFEKAATDSSIDYSNHTVYSWSKRLQKALGIEGPVMAFGSACAAGNYAIGTAAAYMKNHDLQVCVAGSAEPFSKIAMAGFSRSRAMTSDYCKPFDKDRNGMMLGEGAAFFVLEKESFAFQRGAKPLAVIGELGLSCDAYHPTAPKPDGSGMVQVMQRALVRANISISDIDWICAHGSGTVASDTAEAKAIVTLSGSDKIPVAGYKGALGHSLGAATAIETAFCIQSILKSKIPPTTNFKKEDAELFIHIVRAPLTKKITRVLNCGYAFGGINSALIIQEYLGA